MVVVLKMNKYKSLVELCKIFLIDLQNGIRNRVS